MGGASSFDHNRLLRDIAAPHLKPLGLKQVGRTRTWISDEQFWIGVVEFQPSQWGRGSYLNVGPMWLWQAPPTPKVFADVAGRTTPAESADQFEAAEDEDAFREGAERLARHAADCIVRLRSAISSYEDAARVAGAPTLWMHPRYPDLHSGIAAGMAGDWGTSETQLTAYVERMRREPDDSLEATTSLLKAVRTDVFALAVQARIEGQRRALKLPATRQLSAPEGIGCRGTATAPRLIAGRHSGGPFRRARAHRVAAVDGQRLHATSVWSGCPSTRSKPCVPLTSPPAPA